MIGSIKHEVNYYNYGCDYCLFVGVEMLLLLLAGPAEVLVVAVAGVADVTVSPFSYTLRIHCLDFTDIWVQGKGFNISHSQVIVS